MPAGERRKAAQPAMTATRSSAAWLSQSSGPGCSARGSPEGERPGSCLTVSHYPVRQPRRHRLARPTPRVMGYNTTRHGLKLGLNARRVYGEVSGGVERVVAGRVPEVTPDVTEGTTHARSPTWGPRRSFSSGTRCWTDQGLRLPCALPATFEELLTDLYEAIEGCLSVDVAHVKTGAHDRVMDIAI